MDALEDELDLRYHRGLKPDVYYRCPCTESLNGALQNELQKNAASLIPVEIVTEFVFAVGSTITIPVDQQPNLIALGLVSAEYPQSVTVDQVLCRDITGKDRLKIQRAVARSFIEVFQSVDGFKYFERQAFNKDGTDGTRFKYVCIDSLQNRDRKSNMKKDGNGTQERKTGLPTYDCGGAIHIKFSTKRDAINVIYKHNPIHRDVQSRPVSTENGNSEPGVLQEATNIATEPPNEQPKKKGRRKKNGQVEEPQQYDGTNLDMSTSPEAQRSPSKKRSRKSGTALIVEEPANKKKRGRPPKSADHSRSSKNGVAPPPTPAAASVPAPKPYKGPCVRCRENKLKCNHAKPTCYECHRGLWHCSYEPPQHKSRSKAGCFNCKQRKRKCTEEKPSCAFCVKVDDDCEYPEPE